MGGRVNKILLIPFPVLGAQPAGASQSRSARPALTVSADYTTRSGFPAARRRRYGRLDGIERPTTRADAATVRISPRVRYQLTIAWSEPDASQSHTPVLAVGGFRYDQQAPAESAVVPRVAFWTVHADPPFYRLCGNPTVRRAESTSAVADDTSAGLESDVVSSPWRPGWWGMALHLVSASWRGQDVTRVGRAAVRHISVCPSGRHAVSLDVEGTLTLWTVGDGALVRAFAPAETVKFLGSPDAAASGVGIVCDAAWWSPDCLVLCDEVRVCPLKNSPHLCATRLTTYILPTLLTRTQAGYVNAVRLDTLTPVLAGEAPAPLGASPTVLGTAADRFTVLQHTRSTVRLRWRGPGPLTKSRAQQLLEAAERSSGADWARGYGAATAQSARWTTGRTEDVPPTPTVSRRSVRADTSTSLASSAGGMGDAAESLDDEDDEDEADLSQLQRVLNRLARPLVRATEYLLWTFDTDPPVPSRQRLHVNQITYGLWTFERATPSELLQLRLAEKNFAAAHALARDYGLDTDPVYLAEWESSPVDDDTIASLLDQVRAGCLAMK